ncbi:MAG: MFS transporter [Jatrophihabitans sp.]
MTRPGPIQRRILRAVGGRARRRVIVLLAAVLALQGADLSTIGAVASQLKPGLHIDNTGLGLLVTVSAGVGALATLPLGAVVDRANRARLLSCGIALWAVVMMVSGSATTFTMLLVTRLALGAVVAVAGPTIASLAGDLFPPGARGELYGFILSGELLGGGFGFLVSGNVSSAFGWRWAFWVMSGLSVLVAWALHRFLPEPARGGASMLHEGADRILTAAEIRGAGSPDRVDSRASPDPPNPLRTQIRNAGITPHEPQVLRGVAAELSWSGAARYIISVRTNLILITASALGYSLYAGVRTFGVIYVQHRFAVGQSIATLLLIVLGAGAVVGVLLTGRIADSLIDRRHLAARPLVAGLAFLAAAVLFIPALLVPSLLVAAPLFFLAAAALGGTNPPLDAARLDLMPARLWGRAESVRTALRSLLEAGAPLLIGVLATQFGTATSGLGQPRSNAHQGNGLSEALLVALLPVLIAGLLLVLRARRTYPRDVATALASDSITAH